MGKFHTKYVGVMNTDIRMYTTNYSARPVTIDDSTVEANEYGHKIVPAGTFLGGGVLADQSKLAVPLTLNGTQAELATTFTAPHSNLIFTARSYGTSGNSITVEFAAPSVNGKPAEIALTGTAIKITLATDKVGTILSTARQIMELIDGDESVNNLVKVRPAEGSNGTGLVEVLSSTALSGGENDSASGTADGVLLHAVDVTYGPDAGTMMIAGFVDLDKLPQDPPSSVVEDLKSRITFMRR